MGATNEEITLDIAVCGTIYPPSITEGNSIDNWQTSRNIHDTYSSTNSIEAEMRSVPGVNIRYYF